MSKPLVSGLRIDRKQGYSAPSQFTASLGDVERVDVFPFHALGAPKYAALGLDYPCGDVTPPDEKQLAQVRAVFTAAGLDAV